MGVRHPVSLIASGSWIPNSFSLLWNSQPRCVDKSWWESWTAAVSAIVLYVKHLCNFRELYINHCSKLHFVRQWHSFQGAQAYQCNHRKQYGFALSDCVNGTHFSCPSPVIKYCQNGVLHLSMFPFLAYPITTAVLCFNDSVKVRVCSYLNAF